MGIRDPRSVRIIFTDPDPKARDIFTFIINGLNTCLTLPAIYEYLIFIVNNWTSIKLDLKVNKTNIIFLRLLLIYNS
jgi:hypothetical protein